LQARSSARRGRDRMGSPIGRRIASHPGERREFFLDVAARADSPGRG
jgi:hypothetical protein